MDTTENNEDKVEVQTTVRLDLDLYERLGVVVNKQKALDRKAGRKLYSATRAFIDAVTLWLACGSPMEPKEIRRIGALAKVKRKNQKAPEYKGLQQKEEKAS